MLKITIIGCLISANLLLATNANYNCVVDKDACQKEQELFDVTLRIAQDEVLKLFAKNSACLGIKIEDINCSEIKIIDTNVSSPFMVTVNDNLNLNVIMDSEIISTPVGSSHEQLFYPKENHTIVDILYGTDRGLNQRAILEQRYTGERSNLKWGVAQVSVPHSHVFGELERPFFDSNEKIGEDIVITQLYDISNKRFRELFKAKLGKVSQDDILIFIHGYNVTFASAIRQTAQLSYDLQFKGVPLTYSWTSQGGLSTYPKDEASVMYTIPKLVAFLQEVIKNKGKAKIHILAHSMGTRALTNALRDISFLYDSPQFKNVILAAPDIDAEVFSSNLYPYILKTTEKMTIYASSEDKALDASNALHGAKRLGEGGENISLFKDVVSIDASGVDSSFLGLGHSYFAQKELLVNDLRALVHKSLPPQERDNLFKRLKAKLYYWKFK